MSNVREIENISYGVQNLDQPAEGQKKANNINLEAASNTFEPFPCATAWFINSAADLYYKNTYDNKVLLANTAAEGKSIPLAQIRWLEKIYLRKKDLFLDISLIDLWLKVELLLRIPRSKPILLD